MRSKSFIGIPLLRLYACMIAVLMALHACGGGGGGGQSAADPTAPASPTLPGAPTGVTAVAGNASATVSWTQPDNGGSAITGYTVTSSPGGVVKTAAGGATSAVVTGLTNGVSYSFTVYATNALGNGPSSAPSPAVTPSAGASGVFPLVYSPNGRYLQDQAGSPFPILGRTAWFVISLEAARYQQFLADSTARGYNAIEMMLITHHPGGNRAPFNGNGDAPFLKTLSGSNWNGALSYSDIAAEAPDFTTPNEAYWSFVDTFLSYCESQGILVFLFPAYAGLNGGNDGWMQEMVANGAARMRSYGAWLAARYMNRGNLVWMMGGDMGSFSQAQYDVESALLAGMQSVAGQQSRQFSAEWNSETIATDQGQFGSSMTLNGVYSWLGNVADHGLRAYDHSPALPAFLLEEPYDEEGPDGNGVNPHATQPVRRFQWWGWLSTIGGYISGNGYVCGFTANWESHLDTQGSRDMARLNAFLKSISWWELVPSGHGGMKTLVTAGAASGDTVAAAATPSGTLLVAYIPPMHSGTVTIDMTALSGSARARWFNPATAAYTVIGTYPNSGQRTFEPPGDNGSGYADWVLVIEKQ